MTDALTAAGAPGTVPGGAIPHFPGAVGITDLEVYPWGAADGVHGGSPHVHLVCAEAYVVVRGSGRVQTLSPAGSAELPLSVGDVVWYEPGTVHRSVNDGDLKVIAIMQNSGLPEAGDAVMTFPPEDLATPEAYARAATPAGPDGTPSEAAARARRDRAMTGFAQLREAVDRGDVAPLLDFYRAAAALVAPRLDAWRARVESGPLAAARDSLARIDALAAQDIAALTRPATARIPALGEQSFGMCGLLRAYDPVRLDGSAVELA